MECANLRDSVWHTLVYDKLRSEAQNSGKNSESSSQSTTVPLPEIPEAKEDEQGIF